MRAEAPEFETRPFLKIRRAYLDILAAGRRKNMIQPHDPIHSIWPKPHDAAIGSYGFDQCLDLVEEALASGRGESKPDGDEWLEGRGVAIHAQDCASHPARRRRNGKCHDFSDFLGFTEPANSGLFEELLLEFDATLLLLPE